MQFQVYCPAARVRGAIGVFAPVGQTIEADSREQAEEKFRAEWETCAPPDIRGVLKLKARTTYKNADGRQVMIAGLTGETVNGLPVWWSIQGDHYTEDGRFVRSRRDWSKPGELVLLRFTTEDYNRNLASEDDSPAARNWWEGVEA